MTWRSIPRAKARIGTALLLCASLTMGTGAAQEDAAGEAQVRAAILFNLTKFTEWPAWKLPDAQSAEVLCFVGKDPVMAEMEALLARQKTPDRPRVVRRVNQSSEAEGCHVLYVGAGEGRRFGEARGALAKAAVLTIGDGRTSGTILQLPVINDRVQIQVDLGVAQQSGLHLSSKLLQLANLGR